jgi:transcriptional regulator with XRE-family HTH domain
MSDRSLYISGTGVNPYVYKRRFCDAAGVQQPDENLKKLFARRLREQMEDQGLSGNELAKLAKVGQSTVSRVLTGKQDPTLEVIESLASGLDYPAWALLLDSRHIEQRLIKPVLAPAPQEKVVRLPTPYAPIFSQPQAKQVRHKASQRKKR